MSSFFVYYCYMKYNEKINSYLKLAELFNKNGFRLYIVGGAVRDYLLNKELTDMDLTTDATPNDVKTFFIEKADYTFSKFGAMSLYFENIKFEVTTLRMEKSYEDSRHPNEIVFVKEPKLDYKRRDFTINAMYLDERLTLLDFCDGKKDIDNSLIRMVGNPLERINEDPLRILRAIRFALTLSFKIEESLKTTIKNNHHLLDKINKDKIKQELKKFKNINEETQTSLFNEFGMISCLDMVK